MQHTIGETSSLAFCGVPRRDRAIGIPNDSLRIALAALVVPQLSTLFWWAHTGSALHFRGWINVEYLLLLAFALVFPSRWMVAVLTLDLTIALVEPIARLYYFSPADAFYSLRYLRMLPSLFLAECGGLLLIYVVCCATLLRYAVGVRRRTWAWKVSCALALCVLAASAMGVGMRRWRQARPDLKFLEVDARHFHVVSTPVRSLLAAAYPSVFTRIGPLNASPRRLPSAMDAAMAGVVGTRPDVVLVLTESWGITGDSTLAQAQIAPYTNPAIGRLYHVQSGEIAFSGSTTSGESRELCGDATGIGSMSETSAYFGACRPARFADAGYRTLAVHGFTAGMYGRSVWYTRFGFEQTAFLPELVRDGVSLCDGTYPGACDAGVASWIGARLRAPRDPHTPLFVHWVTLNSHLPVPSTPKDAASPACRSLRIDHEPSLCSWFQRIVTVHRSVADLALAPGLRPTVFVVVGDHAPPFLRPELRERFSQSTVPYVILTPRAGDQPGARPSRTTQSRRSAAAGAARRVMDRRTPTAHPRVTLSREQHSRGGV